MAEAIIVQNGNFYWELKSEVKPEGAEIVPPARVWLRGLQLRVRRGEFVSIIGRFGCGKSSLLQALLG
jgi:ABC-type nitrate/sulfonate/bicarbonate transport system ATPase subunit